MSTRTMIGVLAAGAASVVLAAGLSGSATGHTGDPEQSPTCLAALEAVVAAEAAASDPDGPGQRRDGVQKTAAEQAKIDAARAAAVNPDGPGGANTTREERAKIHAEQAAAIDPNGDGPLVQDGTVITAEEQAEINAKRAAADKACKGADGKPGEAGTPGPAGPAGEPGAAGADGKDRAPAVDGKYGDLGGSVTYENNTQNNYDYTEAPKPIVQSGGEYPAVTG